MNISRVVTDAKATSDRRVHLGRTEFPESPKSPLGMAGFSPIGGQQPSTEHTGKMQKSGVGGQISEKFNRYHGHAEGQIQDGLYGPIIIEYDLCDLYF